MKKINWGDFLQRIKKGERLGSIAKLYGVHKYYLITSMILKIKDDKTSQEEKKTISEIEEYFTDVFRGVKIEQEACDEISIAIEKAAQKHKKSVNEIIQLFDEYREVKMSDSKLIREYDRYKDEFENIIELFEKSVNDASEIGIELSEKYGANSFKEIQKYFKQNKDFSQILVKYAFVNEVSLLMLNGKSLIESIQIVNSKRNKNYTYQQFVKDINLMGFKVNTKTNILYHLEDENLKELAQIEEARILLEEAEEIKFKRGYQEKDDLYKELEIIALEKGLTKEEFIRVILLKHLDANITKVREFR
ncbi:MAG: hypothetical protein E7C49_19445 [Clostridium sp.]|nr:hypothetical protein [Clostridium sp.]